MLFDRKNGSFKRYTTREGLPNNTVLRILEDKKGSLWLSTYNGLSKFDPVKNEWQNFYQSDGLQSNQFSFNGALALQSGEFLFGGIKGFNIFNPDSIYARGLVPKIYLSGLRVNNSPIKDDEGLVKERNFEHIKKIVVPYDKAILTLDYLGLDYTDASNLSYAYRLTSWDKHWNYVNHRVAALVSNLVGLQFIFPVCRRSVLCIHFIQKQADPSSIPDTISQP